MKQIAKIPVKRSQSIKGTIKYRERQGVHLPSSQCLKDACLILRGVPITDDLGRHELDVSKRGSYSTTLEIKAFEKGRDKEELH